MEIKEKIIISLSNGKENLVLPIDKLHLGFLIFLKGSNNQIIERGGGKDHYVRLDLLSIMSDVAHKTINPLSLKK